MFGSVVAVVNAYELKHGADLLAGVRNVQRNENEVAFGAEDDDLRGGRAEGLDVLDGGAEELLVPVPDTTENGRQVIQLAEQFLMRELLRKRRGLQGGTRLRGRWNTIAVMLFARRVRRMKDWNVSFA
jgi:hypothetical protein